MMFILSSPSGVGKTTLTKKLAKNNSNFKSKVYQTFFRLTNGAISVECEDWSSKFEKNLNYTDRLKIYVLTEKYNNWLNYEAYK